MICTRKEIVLLILLYFIWSYCSSLIATFFVRRGAETTTSDTVLDGRSQFSDRNLIHACISDRAVNVVIAKNDEERVYAAHRSAYHLLTSRVHAESG